MADSPLGLVMERLRRLVLLRDASAWADEKLLELFLQRRDEAAFEAIVRRHGDMVMGVCRRVLRNHHDAEDAFQATFLVLARKAAAIASRASLASWLYGVAYKTARKAKAALARRRFREREGATMPKPETIAPEQRSDLDALLDQELNRLPEKYRAVVVVCDLEGRTRKEAAARLGCPEGTVASRLARARALLAKRLAQRGVALSAAALVGQESLAIASAVAPASLIASTSKAAILYAAGQSVSHLVSTQVAALAAGVIQTMLVAKIKTLAFAALLLGLTTWGGGSLLPGEATIAQAEQKTPAEAAGKMERVGKDAKPTAPANRPDDAAEKDRKDLFGDPLPPNALARLGSNRLRHGEQIRNLNFSRDGKTLLSADWHGVHIWDVATGAHLRKIGDPKGNFQFQSAAASADNRVVALSVSKGEIEIWDGATGRLVHRLQANRFPFLELTPDGSILAVSDSNEGNKQEGQRIRLFDTATGHERSPILTRHEGWQFFKLAHDGKSLLTWGDDKTIRLWDIGAGKQSRTIELSAPAHNVVLSPDNRFVATVEAKIIKWEGQGGTSGEARMAIGPTVLWNFETGKEIGRFAANHDDASPVLFSPDGKFLITSDKEELRWWDVATGKERPEKKIQLGFANTIAFSPDQKTLAIAGQSIIHLWDLVAGKERPQPKGHVGLVASVAASPDGSVFATAGAGGTIHFWDSSSGRNVRDIHVPDGYIWRIRFVLDGTKFVTSDHEDTIRVYDALTGKEIRRFTGIQFVLSPDGKLLASYTKEQFVQVWELSTGRERGKWKADDLKADLLLLGSMAFSADGRSLSYYGNDQRIHERDVATGKIIRQFDGPRFPLGGQIAYVTHSPDGKLAAFGYSDGSIAIQEMATGQIATLRSSKPEGLPRLSPLVFSADGRFLAGSIHLATIHVWEIATAQEFRQFEGHRGPVLSLVFSVDGSRLISGSQDATGLVWDVTGQHSQRPGQPLTNEGLQKHWAELGSKEAAVAQRAVGILAARPKQFLPLCREFPRPVPYKDAETMDRLIARLDDGNFQTRLAANRELEELGGAAEPALRRALENSPSLEARRRIDALLKKLADDPERLRMMRVLQVLEQSGTQESREALQALADGAAGAWLTTEARAALGRLPKRSERTP